MNRKDIPVGGTLNYEGNELTVLANENCTDCFFLDIDCTEALCGSSARKDHTNVIFQESSLPITVGFMVEKDFEDVITKGITIETLNNPYLEIVQNYKELITELKLQIARKDTEILELRQDNTSKEDHIDLTATITRDLDICKRSIARIEPELTRLRQNANNDKHLPINF